MSAFEIRWASGAAGSRIDVTAPEAERWRGVRHFYEQNGFTYAGPKLRRLL